ncbi:MAG: phospho-N-acetylmuramoyl-pentapeptide-transferase [Brevinema sp.]
MFFHFLSEYINLFRYISFRSIGAAVSSFLIVLWIAPKIIDLLRTMKFGQQVRQEGPSAHLIKTGTPTMGGIFMWGGVVISTLLWAAWNGFVLITCLTVVLFAGIGFIDDYAKIKQKDTKGLSTKGKLFIQSLCAFVILLLVYLMPQYHQQSRRYILEITNKNTEVLASTNVNITDDWQWDISYPSNAEELFLMGTQYNPETGKTIKSELFQIPFLTRSGTDTKTFTSSIVTNNNYKIISELTMIFKQNQERQLPKTITNIYQARLFNSFLIPLYTEVVWYWPLWLAFLIFIFIVVGVSNATNLSDGLDGLATGMGIPFYLSFGVFAYLIGNVVLSGYLFYPYIMGIGELTIFISAAIGAFAGFLWYNVHPAEVFMGDTGSLPMGAAIAVIAIMLKQELLLMVSGFMFVLETVSVIIQVFCFKRYGKRIFKMAPIHHHFELSGWKENQVVVRFWILSVLCAILALATIKIR